MPRPPHAAPAPCRARPMPRPPHAAPAPCRARPMPRPPHAAPAPLQVNPLAEDVQGRLIAADAKLGFDDNAAFRQKEIFAMRDESQMDPRWARRSRRGGRAWGGGAGARGWGWRLTGGRLPCGGGGRPGGSP
jgi:hypothetical protein